MHPTNLISEYEYTEARWGYLKNYIFHHPFCFSQSCVTMRTNTRLYNIPLHERITILRSNEANQIIYPLFIVGMTLKITPSIRDFYIVRIFVCMRWVRVITGKNPQMPTPHSKKPFFRCHLFCPICYDLNIN